MIKILIADDHKLLRDGLKSVLLTDEKISIIGEANNGEEAYLNAITLSPDILLLDLNMPVMSGLEVVQKIRQQNLSIKILILTMHNDEATIVNMIEKGIQGYVLKSSPMDELLKAIHTIAKGENYFPDEISAIMLNQYIKKIGKKKPAAQPQVHLTKREKDIIRLIAKGYTSHEIAAELFISYFTVGKHRKNVMKKLGLKSAASLISYAVNEGLIEK